MKYETRLILSAKEKERLLDFLQDSNPICHMLDCKGIDNCSKCPLDELTDQLNNACGKIRHMVFNAKVEE